MDSLKKEASFVTEKSGATWWWWWGGGKDLLFFLFGNKLLLVLVIPFHIREVTLTSLSLVSISDSFQLADNRSIHQKYVTNFPCTVVTV